MSKKTEQANELLENPFGEGDVQKVFQKAKRKSLFRNILVSTSATILILGGAFILNQSLVNEEGWRAFGELEGFHRFAGANIHVANAQFQHGLGQGTLQLTTYKFIGDRTVPWGEKVYEFGLVGDPSLRIGNHSAIQYIDDETNLEVQINRFSNAHNGEYEIQFYNPVLSYPKYMQDLDLLDEMRDDQIIEMGLSFDQGYSLDEVNAMLPPQVKPVWYRVQDLTQEQVKKLGGNHSPDTASHVYGFHAYREPASRTFVNTEETFLNDLEVYMNYAKSHYRGQAEQIHQAFKENEKDGRIIGVVVTGSKEELKSLVGKPYIKAAVLGATIDKY